jgi:biopolymer transport protein ExbB/TolQ
MKRLRRYYFQVIGMLTLLVGAGIAFFPQIATTVKGNPHPQINYIIFVLIFTGAVLVLMHVRRINREGDILQRFIENLVQESDPAAARAVLGDLKSSRFGGRSDIADVLLLLSEAVEWPADETRISILENEVERYQARLNRRLLLTQYLGGMMVGMGLLGTFIGLLGALAEIGKLIGSFGTMMNGTTDPASVLGELVTRLNEPMKAMAVAFSASLFGVLGSLIMGLFMVVVKSATGDIVSILYSQVSLILDFKPHEQADTNALNEALAGLAQQSPILQGLAAALDQSERRVREVLSSTASLIARMENNTQAQERVEVIMERMAQAQATSQRAQDEFLTKLEKIAQVQDGLGRQTERFAEAFAEQQRLLETQRQEQAAQLQELLQHQSDLLAQHESAWRSHAEEVGHLGDQQAESWKELVAKTEATLSLFRRIAEDQMSKDRQSWQEQFAKQQEMLALFRKSVSDQANAERTNWQEQFAKQQETLGLFRRTVADQTAEDRGHWQEQFNQQQASLGLMRKQIVEQQQLDREQWQQALMKQGEEFASMLRGVFDQLGAERGAWSAQGKELSASVDGIRQSVQSALQSWEKRFDQQIQRWEEAGAVVDGGQKKLAEAFTDFSGLVNETVSAIRTDSRSRTEFTVQFDRYVREYQDRQEQLMHTLTTTIGSALKEPGSQ